MRACGLGACQYCLMIMMTLPRTNEMYIITVSLIRRLCTELPALNMLVKA